MRAHDLPEHEIQRRLDAIFDGGPVCAEDRRYAMRLRGVTDAQIRREAAVSAGASSNVSETLSGIRPGKRIRPVIAAAVGVPEDRLWPEERP